jgi:hypothetical protein
MAETKQPEHQMDGYLSKSKTFDVYLTMSIHAEAVGDIELNEMPTGRERRLVLRLLSYWRELLKDEQDSRLFPSFADIDPTAIYDIWQHCFAMDLFGHESGPVFRAVGLEFSNYFDGTLANRPVSELNPDTLTAQSTCYFNEVLEKNAPISRGGQISGLDGSNILYRSILLPMSDDGETISGFLGAANCREERLGADPDVARLNDIPTDETKEFQYDIF